MIDRPTRYGMPFKKAGTRPPWGWGLSPGRSDGEETGDPPPLGVGTEPWGWGLSPGRSWGEETQRTEAYMKVRLSEAE